VKRKSVSVTINTNARNTPSRGKIQNLFILLPHTTSSEMCTYISWNNTRVFNFF